MAHALINIGAVYTEKEEYLKGRDHFMEGLLLGEEVHDNISTSNALIGLGQIEQKLGNHSLAKEYFYMALEITKKLGNKEDISASLLGLAVSHALQGNHGKAIELGSDAMKIAADIPTQTRAAAKILYESYKAIGMRKPKRPASGSNTNLPMRRKQQLTACTMLLLSTNKILKSHFKTSWVLPW